jgi:hypothetical protein
MITFTNPTTDLTTPGRTHPTVITPTCPETARPDVTRTVPVKTTAALGCSIWRPGPGMHPLGNATRSRDAP